MWTTISSIKCSSPSGALLCELRIQPSRLSACFDAFAKLCPLYNRHHDTWDLSSGLLLRYFSSDTWPSTRKHVNYCVSQFSNCQIKDQSKSMAYRKLCLNIDMVSERLRISSTKVSRYPSNRTFLSPSPRFWSRV